MPIHPRYLTQQIEKDLERKMVFLAGPRQVGKTTVARSLKKATGGYLSWDISADRERITLEELPVSTLWVFDEIHKYRKWRAFLKGLYDGRRPGQRILVTGSARLVREDVSTLERVLDLDALERLAFRLPALVGSPLSINALREDLEISQKSATHWISILEKLYAIFRLPPFGSPRIRAVKKEQKHYHFDWSLVPEEPADSKISLHPTC